MSTEIKVELHCLNCMNNSVTRNARTGRIFVLCPKENPQRAFLFDEVKDDLELYGISRQKYRKVARSCPDCQLEEGRVV
jgi:hypothetical protein